MTSTVNVFFLPFSGASAYSYTSFVAQAPPWMRIVPLELPGRGRRFAEPLLFDVESMVDDLLPRLLEQHKAQPYALYGHSLGTLLGLRLAQRLSAQGIPPVYLFFSGRAGPSIPYKDRDRHLLPRAQFLEKILEMGGSPPQVLENEELMDLFEPILRADVKAAETFQYGQSTPLPIPIAVMIGADENISLDAAMAWQLESSHPIHVQVFPGHHFFIYGKEAAIMHLLGTSIQKTLLAPSNT